MRKREPSARVQAVLVPVLIQDPSVAASGSRVMSLLHPVVVRDEQGFAEGPACRRAAVVDLNFHAGRLGPPAVFDAKGSPYRDVAMYRVAVPTRKGARLMPWSRSQPRVGFEALRSPRYASSFLKVSVFGTVLRTLGMVQDRTALGREVKWAFPGEQLLIVPRAGMMENAFYHRDSRSLQFYYGLAGEDAAVYSGLSQDIVAHETTHAIVDGIAPDLYDALSVESLAIHEALADITATFIALRNREVLPQNERETAETLREIAGSSRFSRIAEEFGKWRGHGEALRDVCNAKTLDPEERDPALRVDQSSPHSLSEVLSGALFEVFSNEFRVQPDDPILQESLHKQHVSDKTRWRTTYAVSRVMSLIYKGLDWLPPGEASFAELIQAMVAADEWYVPRGETGRGVLLREARRRHMLAESSPKVTFATGLRGNAFQALRASAEARREFVRRQREALGIPAEARVQLRWRLADFFVPDFFLHEGKGETFHLSPKLTRRERENRIKYLVFKLGWWRTERNDVGGGSARNRRFKAGATFVFEQDGRLRTVLRTGADPRQAGRRSDLLRRLLVMDGAAPGEHRSGPDGEPLAHAVCTRLRGDVLSVSGGFQMLHIAGDEP